MKQKQVEKQIDKLLSEYSRKVFQKKSEIKILFIEFTTEYNKIWKDFERCQK